MKKTIFNLFEEQFKFIFAIFWKIFTTLLENKNIGKNTRNEFYITRMNFPDRHI